MPSYIFANSKPWNDAAHRRHNPPGRWTFINQKEVLTRAVIDDLAPRYIFLPHWSWKVPADLVAAYECVGLHMTNLPYGRGGTPLQNLIDRGHRDTTISAFRMTDELDAGPIYLKRPLSLGGSAREIFERYSDIAIDMIAEIIRTEPQPTPQTGEPVFFKRRNPEQSRLPEFSDHHRFYDFVRMLDCEGYPRAFLDIGGMRLYFKDAKMTDGKLTATVTDQP